MRNKVSVETTSTVVSVGVGAMICVAVFALSPVLLTWQLTRWTEGEVPREERIVFWPLVALYGIASVIWIFLLARCL